MTRVEDMAAARDVDKDADARRRSFNAETEEVGQPYPSFF